MLQCYRSITKWANDEWGWLRSLRRAGLPQRPEPIGARAAGVTKEARRSWLGCAVPTAFGSVASDTWTMGPAPGSPPGGGIMCLLTMSYAGVDNHLVCPRCGGQLRRIPRRVIDRLVSIVIPLHRYECVALGCYWQGSLRVRRIPHSVERKEPTLRK